MRRYFSRPFLASTGRNSDSETLVSPRPDDAPPPYSAVVPSAPPLQHGTLTQGGAPRYSGPPPTGYYAGASAYPHTAGYQYTPYSGNCRRNPNVVVLRDGDHVEKPMVTYCHNCRRNVISRVTYRDGSANEGLLCLTSLLGCFFWPVCLLLPFCLLCDRDSSAVHYCPRCRSKLAEYEL